MLTVSLIWRTADSTACSCGVSVLLSCPSTGLFLTSLLRVHHSVYSSGPWHSCCLLCAIMLRVFILLVVTLFPIMFCPVALRVVAFRSAAWHAATCCSSSLYFFVFQFVWNYRISRFVVLWAFSVGYLVLHKSVVRPLCLSSRCLLPSGQLSVLTAMSCSWSVCYLVFHLHLWFLCFAKFRQFWMDPIQGTSMICTIRLPIALQERVSLAFDLCTRTFQRIVAAARWKSFYLGRLCNSTAPFPSACWMASNVVGSGVFRDKIRVERIEIGENCTWKLNVYVSDYT